VLGIVLSLVFAQEQKAGRFMPFVPAL